MTPVRVLSANIQSGRRADGEQATAAELAGAFEPIEADVVALQEVDRNQPRSGTMDQVRIIADALGLPHYRFGAAIAGDVERVREVADPIGNHPGPAYGVALLSRYPVIAWFATHLPQVVRRLPTWRGFRPGWWVHEPRVGLAAVLAGPDGPFVAASAHLSLLPPVGRYQLRALLGKVEGLASVLSPADGGGAAGVPSPADGDGSAGGMGADGGGAAGDGDAAGGVGVEGMGSEAAARAAGRSAVTGVAGVAADAGLPGRMIVAGDFNLPEPTVAKSAPDWELPRALTFHADLPVRQIDHILVRGGATTHTEAHRLTISDHRALSTQVHWA